MKIFFLVLMAVFLTIDIIVAAPGDGEAAAPQEEVEEEIIVPVENTVTGDEKEEDEEGDEEEEDEDDKDDDDDEAAAHEASPGDEGDDDDDEDEDDEGNEAGRREYETSKSQLDMILLQMERQKDQIKAQEHKNEEQQDQIKAQERKIEEQQRQNDEQQQQLQEFTKTIRARRSESDIVNDLKELIRAEINGLSQCVIGTYTTTKGSSQKYGFSDTMAVSFGRTFPRKPKVVASVAGFLRTQYQGDYQWGLKIEARSPTTSNFTLYVQGYDTYVNRLDVSWIACA